MAEKVLTVQPLYPGMAVTLYGCIAVWLYCCIAVLLYRCISVSLYCCIAVSCMFCLQVVHNENITNFYRSVLFCTEYFHGIDGLHQSCLSSDNRCV